jgi:hypothetical protein
MANDNGCQFMTIAHMAFSKTSSILLSIANNITNHKYCVFSNWLIYQCLAHTYFFFFQVTFVVLVSFDYLLTSVQKLMVLVWNIILVIHVYIFLFPTINVCTLIIFNITFNKRINKPTETQSLKPCLGLRFFIKFFMK